MSLYRHKQEIIRRINESAHKYGAANAWPETPQMAPPGDTYRPSR